MANWGQDVTTGFTTPGSVYGVLRGMGGTSPNEDGMVLDSVSIRLGLEAPNTNRSTRMAVYQGGTLSDPTGATLVEDLGIVTTTTATQTWYTLTSSSNPSLTKNVPTWIISKNNEADSLIVNYSSSSGDVVDFQTARGRVGITGLTGGVDETVAYPSTLDGTPSFNTVWLPMYLTYSIAPTSPTITSQPSAVTTVLAGPVSNNPATFSVSATTSGGSLTYDWELEDGVGSGVYANLADGNGATWTGQTSATCSATITATTLSGRRVRCNVTDDNGTTTTDAVALTIKAGTTIAQPAATDGSGVATAVLTTDVVDSANGQLKLVTFTSGSTVIRTTARKTA